MATIQLGSVGDDGAGNPLVQFELEVDSNNRATALRCINNSTEAAWGSLTQASSGRTVGLRFPPGTTVLAIPTTVALRIMALLDSRGRLTNIDRNIVWPYP